VDQRHKAANGTRLETVLLADVADRRNLRIDLAAALADPEITPDAAGPVWNKVRAQGGTILRFLDEVGAATGQRGRALCDQCGERYQSK
jgi:hypothetical protein